MKNLLLLPLVSLISCGFVTLPIEKGANTSRVDAQAADGKGGWLDLGSNDLHVLPAGEANYAGVSFVVPPAGDETAKNCIVIGRSGPEKSVLKLEKPVAGKRLYLLHAIAEGPVMGEARIVGKVVLRYDDGSSSECEVEAGRDVIDWTGGRSLENAVRAWTEYNHNTQVSLYASKFGLDEKKSLAELTFAANGRRPWMIVAATVGDDTKLRPIRSSVEPTGSYKSPEPPAGLRRFPNGQKPKNIILVIGDGMGHGAAQLASYYKHGRADALYFHQLPVIGLCSTFSANAPVTDSAASATAFATGTKTSNGVLGLQVDKQHDRDHAVPLVSVAARAHQKGLGVAILSSDPLYGATPSAFFAHVPSRGMSEEICAQAATCGYDILIGAGSTEAWLRPDGNGGKRKDGRDLVGEMAKGGYAFVHAPDEIVAAPKGSKVLGSMTSFGAEEAIGAVVTASLDRLAGKSEGFFMMAECADTDHANHGNDSSFAIKAVSMVEYMAKAAIDFAQARGDTLVIVTADHDTGHPSVLWGAGPSGRLYIQWTTTSHTGFPVPVYAYGPGAELFEGLFDNTDIAKNVARLMNLPE